jgi:MFS family permease
MITTVAHTLTHSFVNTHIALVPVFRDELNLSTEVVSLMVAIPLLTQALAGFPFGMLADRVKHSRQIALSLLFAGAGGILVTQSQTALTLIISFSILALSLASFHPPAYSIISEIFGSKHRSVALGIHGAGGTLGMAIGPISVGLVMYFFGTHNWRMSYLIWAAPALVCCVLVLILEPKAADPKPVEEVEERRGRVSIRSVFTLTYILFLLMLGIHGFGGTSVSTYMTTYLKEVHGMPVDFASILFGSMPLMGIIAAPLGGIVADRRGERYGLTLAYLGQTLTLLGFALSPNLAFIVPSVLLYGFFGYVGMAPASSYVAQFTPRGRRGVAYALYFLPTNLVSSIAPVTAAFVVQQWGIWYVFPLGIAVYVATLGILRILPK